jgi:hypothetical protein
MTPPKGNRLIDVELLAENIQENLLCRFCRKPVQLVEVNRKGLASTFVFECSKNCRQPEFNSCQQQTVGNATVNLINRRAAFAMRCIGCDFGELKTFCGIMDLPPPVHKSSQKAINKTLHTAATTVQIKSMMNAADLEYSLAEEIPDTHSRDIDASHDGTWMTPGHSSKVGVTVTVGYKTGKVIDTEALSKVCKGCEYWEKQDHTTDKYKEWKDHHDDDCTLTHEGSSGSMEAAGLVAIYGRSEEFYNLRYTGFIGDGDVNAHKKVCESEPYGPETNITKLECVGHVQKRLGTRLRNLKKKSSVPLGGRNKLTDKKIDQLQQFYGNAIRENKNNLAEMRKAVWAVYFHYASSDDEPCHGLCSISWCKYKQAERDGQLEGFRHKGNLPPDVCSEIKPVFKDLTHPDLLKRCLQGCTQNANESLNSTVWKYCTKKKNHGLKSVETAVAIAVSVFNQGSTVFLDMLQQMCIVPGDFARDFCARKDSCRIKQAQKEALQSTKESRQARRRARLQADEIVAQREGQPYAAGAY